MADNFSQKNIREYHNLIEELAHAHTDLEKKDQNIQRLIDLIESISEKLQQEMTSDLGTPIKGYQGQEHEAELCLKSLECKGFTYFGWSFP